jgi:hypothetical protein
LTGFFGFRRFQKFSWLLPLASLRDFANGFAMGAVGLRRLIASGILQLALPANLNQDFFVLNQVLCGF